MRERLEKRLQDLKAEFEIGRQKLEDLEAQANNMRNTLLRISGAIQVLEEELNAADHDGRTEREEAGRTTFAGDGDDRQPGASS